MNLDRLDKKDLMELLAQEGRVCVSLFMPVHRYGPEMQQNPVRLKNLLREAEAELTERGIEAAEAATLLDPLAALTEHTDFWLSQGEGLAMFCRRGFYRYLRVPIELRERVVVGERFFLKSLLPALGAGGPFYILALSLNRVRLLEASRHQVREVSLAGVPGSFDQALGYDQYDSSTQIHSSSPSGLGRQPAIVHGHGDGDQDRLKKDILRYFQLVAKGIRPHLADPGAPLVLAAVESHFPIFRAAMPDGPVIVEGVPGNSDTVAPEELLRKAWPVVEPWLLREREEALARFRELSGSERASDRLETILPAAHQGRVEVLFLTGEEDRWGTYDESAGTLEVHLDREGGDEELLESAAAQTLAQGGIVYSLDAETVPRGAPLAAVFRY